MIGNPASAQKKGGNKPPPPPNIPRPICFWGDTQKPNEGALRRVDLQGTSTITVTSGLASYQWPRWSPNGLFIGCYFKVVGRERALMVTIPGGGSEQVILTEGQFNTWNLSRPGVLESAFYRDFYGRGACWLGNDAFVFTGETTYDATLFGGNPGETITATGLFIVDADGTITPLTETEEYGLTRSESFPHWSAAHNKIVFVEGRFSTGELYAINPDGTELQQITFMGFASGAHHAIWSPAGDRLAVCAGGSPHLWILDVDLSQPFPGTGEGGRVTAELPFKTSKDAQHSSPSWSPDGRFLVYCHDDVATTYRYLVVADVATGTESTIVGPATRPSGPDWDPLDILP
jgi:Tol biopolymer transport system component